MTRTQQPAPAGDRWMSLTPVGAEVHARIQQLQDGALANRSVAVAGLARLRRGVGKPAGSVPDVLQYTVSDVFAPPGSGDQATTKEVAAHVALTLYAVHQQSQRTRMHQRGWNVGRAVRKLHPQNFGDKIPPVLHRFRALGSAQSVDELVHHLRGTVQLLRGQGQPLDYALLADELVLWQRPGGASTVRLRWGRTFYRTAQPDQPASGDQPADSH